MMFSELDVGSLIEPLSGRTWDRQAIAHQFHQRLTLYQGRGVGPSGRVFLHDGNRLEFFADLLAIWALGGCVIPIDARLTPFEIEMLARVATPRFSVWSDTADAAVASSLTSLGTTVLETGTALVSPHRALRDDSTPKVVGPGLRLDDPALILFTSGTTGQPKGVVHTHRSLRARWITLRQSLGLSAFRRTLCLLPTHFGHGLICNCLYPWLFGQDLVIVPPFEPATVMHLGKLLDEHRITFMSSVPTVWRLALKMAAPPQSKTLRRVFCGSGRIFHRSIQL